LDSFFAFSSSLGSNYDGYFVDRDVLVITVRNSTGAGPPRLGNMTVRVLLSGDLRNYPRASSPITTLSPTLTGAFGASSLKIKGLVADGSNRQDANFGEGDTIEVVFNQPVNIAEYPLSAILSMRQVLSILAFSHDLGTFYGRWRLAQSGVGADSMIIYISNASGVLGPPVETGRTSAAEPPFALDPTDFISEYQVAWVQGPDFASLLSKEYYGFQQLPAALAFYDKLNASMYNSSIFFLKQVLLSTGLSVAHTSSRACTSVHRHMNLTMGLFIQELIT
jgi:hypothetical protein